MLAPEPDAVGWYECELWELAMEDDSFDNDALAALDTDARLRARIPGSVRWLVVLVLARLGERN